MAYVLGVQALKGACISVILAAAGSRALLQEAARPLSGKSVLPSIPRCQGCFSSTPTIKAGGAHVQLKGPPPGLHSILQGTLSLSSVLVNSYPGWRSAAALSLPSAMAESWEPQNARIPYW